MEKFKKGFLSVWLLVVIIVLISGGATYFLLSKNTSEEIDSNSDINRPSESSNIEDAPSHTPTKPEQKEASSNQSSLDVFKSKTGFTFLYPVDWEQHEVTRQVDVRAEYVLISSPKTILAKDTIGSENISNILPWNLPEGTRIDQYINFVLTRDDITFEELWLKSGAFHPSISDFKKEIVNAGGVRAVKYSYLIKEDESLNVDGNYKVSGIAFFPDEYGSKPEEDDFDLVLTGNLEYLATEDAFDENLSNKILGSITIPMNVIENPTASPIPTVPIPSF